MELPKRLSRTVIYESEWINLYTDRDASCVKKRGAIRNYLIAPQIWYFMILRNAS